MPYSVKFEPDAEAQFLALDNSIRIQIAKKLKQLMRDDFKSRHLKHGSPFFVEEIGQYRIGFYIEEDKKEKWIFFVGDHKEYEKWCNSQI